MHTNELSECTLFIRFAQSNEWLRIKAADADFRFARNETSRNESRTLTFPHDTTQKKFNVFATKKNAVLNRNRCSLVSCYRSWLAFIFIHSSEYDRKKIRETIESLNNVHVVAVVLVQSPNFCIDHIGFFILVKWTLLFACKYCIILIFLAFKSDLFVI